MLPRTPAACLFALLMGSKMTRGLTTNGRNLTGRIQGGLIAEFIHFSDALTLVHRYDRSKEAHVRRLWSMLQIERGDRVLEKDPAGDCTRFANAHTRD
jgi:hypothetical protein